MTMILPHDLEEQLHHIAEREQRTPENVVRRRIATLLHGLGDLEQELMAYGVDEKTLTINQSLLTLLGGLRSEFDGDHEEAAIRIRVTTEHLESLI